MRLSSARMFLSRPLIAFVAAALCFSFDVWANEADELRKRHEALAPALLKSAFDSPLHMVSQDRDNHVQSEVHGVLVGGFDDLRRTLRRSSGWCEAILLHPMMKGCDIQDSASTTTLMMYTGGRRQVSKESARRAEYRWTLQADRPDYFSIGMVSEGGPLDTHDYRLTFEAVPLNEREIFVRVAFSFRYRLMTKMLSATYYAFARSRPGFTIVRTTDSGEPVYVTGRVAALERNVMRFYLALQVAIEGAARADIERSDWELRRWFALSQKYPRQLGDMREQEYLDAKRRERAAEQTPPAPKEVQPG